MTERLISTRLAQAMDAVLDFVPGPWRGPARLKLRELVEALIEEVEPKP